MSRTFALANVLFFSAVKRACLSRTATSASTLGQTAWAEDPSRATWGYLGPLGSQAVWPRSDSLKSSAGRASKHVLVSGSSWIALLLSALIMDTWVPVHCRVRRREAATLASISRIITQNAVFRTRLARAHLHLSCRLSSIVSVNDPPVALDLR